MNADVVTESIFSRKWFQRTLKPITDAGGNLAFCSSPGKGLCRKYENSWGLNTI